VAKFELMRRINLEALWKIRKIESG